MKKKLAIILSLVIILGSFSGCSQADMGYLRMSEEASNIKTSEIKGNAELTVNMDLIESYMETVLGYPVESEEVSPFRFNGKISMTYDAKLKIGNTLNGSMNFGINVNGKNVSLKGLLITNDGIYISKDLLMNLFDVLEAIDNNKESVASTEKFRNQLSKKLIGVNYVKISDNEEMEGFVSQMQIQSLMNNESLKFIQKAFSGYSPECISSIQNGYKLSLTMKQAEVALIKAIDYIINNQDTFFEASKEYTKNFNTLLTTQQKALDEALTSFNEDKSEFTQSLITLKAAIQMFMDDEISKDFQQSYLTNTLTQYGQEYRETQDLNVIYQGKTLIRIVWNNTISSKSVTIDAPTGKIISIDEMSSNMNEIYDQINPLKDVKISWYPDDNYAETEYLRTNEEPYWYSFDNNYDLLDCTIKDGSLYLPLRDIVEGLGLQVKWDAKAKKAYVMKHGESIAMTGILIDSKYFTKVRDFEKLNYKVSYAKNNGVNVVTISVQ